MKYSLPLLASFLVAGIAAPAEAAYVQTLGSGVSYTIDGLAASGLDVYLNGLSATQENLFRTFDLGSVGYLELKNAAIVQGNDTADYLQNKIPAGLSDTDHYIAVYGSNPYTDFTEGSANFSLVGGRNTVSFVWGTIDNYNTLLVTNQNDVTYTIAGSDLLSLLSLSSGTTGKYFSFTDMVGIKYVEFLSTGNAFEIGNITLSNVPLPAALPLFAAGLFGLMGYKGRKNKKTLAV